MNHTDHRFCSELATVFFFKEFFALLYCSILVNPRSFEGVLRFLMHTRILLRSVISLSFAPQTRFRAFSDSQQHTILSLKSCLIVTLAHNHFIRTFFARF